LDIINCEFYYNAAQTGGGASFDSGNLSISSSKFSNNIAVYGAGLNLNAVTGVLANITTTSNRAQSGGGIQVLLLPSPLPFLFIFLPPFISFGFSSSHFVIIVNFDALAGVIRGTRVLFPLSSLSCFLASFPLMFIF
jgi:hypothetical protein